MKLKMKVAALQLSCGVSIERNVDRAVEQITRAAEQGANVICLQELFAGQYPCQTEDHSRFDEAEPIPGPTTDRLGQLAKQHGVVIVASLFERRAPGLYHNTAAVLDADGSMVGIYRKMHIPDDPLYYEKFYFTPGDLGFRSFDTRYGRIGVCICWDQWYPEAARLTAMTGAELLVYPTAIGWIPGERETHGAAQYSAWQTMMRSHAIANGVFVAAPNRVGREGEIEFWGGSFICGPTGELLETAPHDDEALLIADCNRAQIDAVRTHWPFFRDRRIDAYQGLTRRWLDDRQ
ncbi:MAG: carbon-nitrogen hydrolase [Planctomycetales bacterium]|nr:carbon-nitrogen hydrolase [Planctomycetales bacterium]